MRKSKSKEVRRSKEVTKAEAEEVRRLVGLAMEAGLLPCPVCCERCLTTDLAAVGVWVPYKQLQIEFWDWQPGGELGWVTYGVCLRCMPDPKTVPFIEAKFTVKIKESLARKYNSQGPRTSLN